MKKSLAVIMTVHNRKDTTLECIRRFFMCEGLESLDIDFYMMDDGSTDGTAEFVQEAFPQVIILKGNGLLFWNRGMYECWKVAINEHHDYYLWLNDDTRVFKDSLDILLRTSSQYGDKVVVVGSTCSKENPKEVTYGGVDEYNNRLTNIEHEQECYTFNGNIVLIPDMVFQIVGLNDPIYHHGAGDYDYGIRVRKAGFQNIIAPGILGICDRHDGLQKWQNPSVPLYKRLDYLFSLNGQTNPGDVFIYNVRYKGVVPAVKYFLICLYRAINPRHFV